LFAIIFAETGLVIAPFLPGDSLLFTVGALAARENAAINIWAISFLLLFAAVLGDAVNYHIGRFIGPRVFKKEASAEKPTLLEKLLNRKHLDRAHAFFEKYGGKAVILARFVPIVRTFIPSSPARAR
jgi:membrane-associated protein